MLRNLQNRAVVFGKDNADLIALARGMAQILGSLAILILAVKRPNELDATVRVAMASVGLPVLF